MLNVTVTKQCSQCKQILPLSEFYKYRRSSDGHQSFCKGCCRTYHRTYRQTERCKVAEKRYRQSKKGKDANKRHRQTKKGKANVRKAMARYRKTKHGKATIKAYCQSEKGKASQQRFCQSEKGKKFFLEAQKRHKAKHPDRLKARYAVSHAIRVGKIPPAKDLQCHYCPSQAKEYHHWHGYAKKHWLDVVPVCKTCHTTVARTCQNH